MFGREELSMLEGPREHLTVENNGAIVLSSPLNCERSELSFHAIESHKHRCSPKFTRSSVQNGAAGKCANNCHQTDHMKFSYTIQNFV